MSYCVEEGFEQNKSFSRTFLIYSAFVLGVCFHRRGGFNNYTYGVFGALVILESGVIDDPYAALITCALSVILCVGRPSDEMIKRLIAVVVILLVGARSVRAKSWFCRTFRGEHELASVFVSVVIGYGASVLFSQRGKWLKVISVLGIVATLIFMSPWHEERIFDISLKGLSYGISYVCVGIVCAFRAKWLWIICSVSSLVAFLVGLLWENFQQGYSHVIVLCLTLTQILLTLPLSGD